MHSQARCRIQQPVTPQAWAGDNLQRLQALLEGRNVQGVRSFLGRPDRSAVSELEVSSCGIAAGGSQGGSHGGLLQGLVGLGTDLR